MLIIVVCNPGPMITEDIGNSTVALGREATLKCVVTHLSDYKVVDNLTFITAKHISSTHLGCLGAY